MRTDQEAWDLALDNKALVMGLIYKYVNSHATDWYKGEDLKAELESCAWEGMHEACRKWDPSKGTLSTYAYPAVTNAMNARMKVLMRMGTKISGGGFKKGEKGVRPYLNSLDGLNALKEKEAFEASGTNAYDSLSESAHNAFMHEPEALMEDVIINALTLENLMAIVNKILDQMEEPYATIIRLMYLNAPTHERIEHGRSLGSGLTLEEVATILGKSTTWVRAAHDEALYYLKQRLEAKGEGYDLD